ncbi:MAG: hypothetical protein M3P08_06170 [Thermoproteota archaeon]|nr:hypothetical protein [Thermoproteota archaeon]
MSVAGMPWNSPFCVPYQVAKTALIKNKARQIIRELAPNNPVYYEKLRERLEKIVKDEEERRKVAISLIFNPTLSR